MKAKKITEREYVLPVLAMLLPIMNSAAELGFSFKMMVLVAVIACFYAGLRVTQKIVEIICAAKYPKPLDTARASADKTPSPSTR